MSITGVLSNAFGAVKAKGLGAARVAARNMGDAGRRMIGEAAQNRSTTMMAGDLAGDIGKYKDEVLAGGRGVMRNATTGNTTSSAANLNLGDKILGGGSGVMRGAANTGSSFGNNLPVQATRNLTNTSTGLDWKSVAGSANRGLGRLTQTEKAGLAGAGIGAAMTAAARGGRGRRRNTWR